MSRPLAVTASALHFVAAPGVVVGLVPWLITDWQVVGAPPYWLPFRVLGLVMIAGGVAVVAAEFVRFANEGDGSPAPVVPTSQLVVGGLYRRVRNPMYVAVATAILGQAALFASWWLAAYALAMLLVMATFVSLYEEPALSRQHGSSYDDYRAQVPAWVPRLRRTSSAHDGA